MLFLSIFVSRKLNYGASYALFQYSFSLIPQLSVKRAKKGLPGFIHTPIGTDFPAVEPYEISISLPVYSSESEPETEDWTQRDKLIFIDPPIDEFEIE